ncbi:AmpG family muropeptide MFS transporter [Marinobacter persicus]|uniref:PAT family beta-lactamase induction signal transducer AmpG n=1 Tax=Marinobacter persicus TaxID=930118 RepID=A0A2S6G610_9GAMM|nr:PAT family beta-lactamase induction signal transducer AmpG [Marinobacter persicus]PPK54560.1 PAT family beta-lactamase induction signal transducer AmpG [Marinobacter persicus]PPK57986.1 PAT family beta-lactamase induction signal transducer AmpG [Marinobacter persicus]
MKETFYVYTRWQVIALLFLGFSAGLPFLLVFSTLNARLADVGVETATIGFFSWLGITYSIKVFWAPIVDRLKLPILDQLFGKRRSWILLAQAGIATGLYLMATVDAVSATQTLALCGLLVAFSSATQDVAIDAYRIEIAEERLQAALAATYIFGYRLALLVAGAGALYIAEYYSWTVSYQVMAALVGVGALTVLVAREPAVNHFAAASDIAQKVREEASKRTHLPPALAKFAGWFYAAIAGPFLDFFQRYRELAIAILVLVAVYRISDIAMGVMANPFYLDFMGFSKTQVADVTKIFGFFMTIVGSLAGGVLVVRYGVRKILLAGAIMTAATNLLFVWLAQLPPNVATLAVVVSADNLAGGIANVALIAWLSSMTSASFTATQYALFSSLMTLPGKFLGGFSGIVVADFGYAEFFTLSAVMGIPAILLVLFLMTRGARLDALAPPKSE